MDSRFRRVDKGSPGANHVPQNSATMRPWKKRLDASANSLTSTSNHHDRRANPFRKRRTSRSARTTARISGAWLCVSRVCNIRKEPAIPPTTKTVGRNDTRDSDQLMGCRMNLLYPYELNLSYKSSISGKLSTAQW